jgi:hypothetical protein
VKYCLKDIVLVGNEVGDDKEPLFKFDINHLSIFFKLRTNGINHLNLKCVEESWVLLEMMQIMMVKIYFKFFVSILSSFERY